MSSRIAALHASSGRPAAARIRSHTDRASAARMMFSPTPVMLHATAQQPAVPARQHKLSPKPSHFKHPSRLPHFTGWAAPPAG